MQYINAVIQWYQTNSDLVGVLLTILAAGLEVSRATGSLRQGVLALMLRAEKENAEKNLPGDVLMDSVIKASLERVVPKLPPYFRPFITERFLRWFAQWVYDGAKKLLKDGKVTPTVNQVQG